MTQPELILEESGSIFAAVFIALLICAVFWCFSSLLYRKIFPAIFKKIQSKKRTVLYQLLNGFKLPLASYLKMSGVAIAILIISNKIAAISTMPAAVIKFFAGMPSFLGTCMRIITIVFVAWGLILSSDITDILMNRTRQHTELRVSKSVARFFSAVINVVVVAFAVVLILSELNFDINGLIAGLGLGGLTIALAAKDSATNFFGGLVLVTEKPFEIGDWISCAGIEGTVEDINLRSTKIRTASGSLAVVPNATLASEPITNWGGVMEKRRADFTITLEYGTENKKIRAFISSIEKMLTEQEDIIADSAVVRFTELANSGYTIRVIFYTAQPALADHLAVCERVNYSICDIAKETPVNFAYPSQTIYLESTEKTGG